MLGYRVIFDQNGFHMDVSLAKDTLQTVYRMENAQGERMTLNLEGKMTQTELRPVGGPAAGEQVQQLPD